MLAHSKKTVVFEDQAVRRVRVLVLVWGLCWCPFTRPVPVREQGSQEGVLLLHVGGAGRNVSH